MAANTTETAGPQAFRKQVKLALMDRNMSARQMAAKLGLHENTVYLAIRHGLGEPTVKKISNFLNISEGGN